MLNLPEERHSHGIRKLAAVEAAWGSFEEAAGAVSRSTGQPIGKCQTESLSARAAADVADFYASRRPAAAPETEVLVISADGKGILMRPDSSGTCCVDAEAMSIEPEVILAPVSSCSPLLPTSCEPGRVGGR